jgi:RHS repeat-associated protein
MMPNDLFKFVTLRHSAGISPNRSGPLLQRLHDVRARYARILQERLRVSTSSHFRPILLALLTTLIAPAVGFAQEAPTGAHYGGRATDTGFGGSLVNATGGFSTSIPLALPAERAGLPVPLQITYGMRGVGAAGLGWDIPFSYIRRDRTFAHRRPAYRNTRTIPIVFQNLIRIVSSYAEDALPRPRERTFLSLLGAGGDLVRHGDTLVVRTGTLELAVRESGGEFLAYDGAGRTYTFTQCTQFATYTSRQCEQFRRARLWLLKSVSTEGGASVQLTYELTTRPMPEHGGTGLEVNLTRIAYNTHPVAGCAKHEIALTYGNSSPSPLSISMLGEEALVRFRTLTRVDVRSRATCASISERLRSYELQYLLDDDPDTKLPRLQSVRMRGRDGTPEAETPIPVASYVYGTATNGHCAETPRCLKYETTQKIDLPPDVDGVPFKISGTAVDTSVDAPGSGERYAMWQSLIDVNGDGRPDLVYQTNNKLHVAFNSPTDGGNTTIWRPQAPVPLYDSTFTKGAFSTHTMTKRRLWWGTANRNTVNIWRQAIDVNGDGRVDIVDAGEVPGHWIVYLNTPGGPQGIKWERRSWSVHNLRRELTRRGHRIGVYLPLSRRTTGVSVNVKVCLKWDGTKWQPYDGKVTQEYVNENGTSSYFTYDCDNGRSKNWPVSGSEPPHCDDEHGTIDCPAPAGIEPEKTFVEWEFTDLNGDGYPDLVFNALPTEFKFTALPPNPEEGRQFFIAETPQIFQLPFSYDGPTNVVRVAYNIVGVRFDTNEANPFAHSVSLGLDDKDTYVGLLAPTYKKAGVGLWIGDNTDGELQNQQAGFADVNGDGLLDYVNGDMAYLGVYHGTAIAVSDVFVRLPTVTVAGVLTPGFLSQQHSNQKDKCPGDKFTSRLTRGLRDLTGDGIPDYWADGRVWIGTGAGFASPIPVQSAVEFQFSHQTESCHGDSSLTNGGLFDIDGDGKPEVIGLCDFSSCGVSGHRFFFVTQLTAGSTARAPEAGRLVFIDNGYGALTQIGYRSAKEDLYSAHQVPFPEIVVTSVGTGAVLELGSSLAGTRYAYGNAHMIFDSARDAFVFPGYGRTVALGLYMGEDRFDGAATVVDYWPLIPFSPGMSDVERWRRTEQVGRVQDIYTLRGSSEVDPWRLLHIDANDPRIIGISHREWGANLIGRGHFRDRDCIEMVDPYDFRYSFMHIGLGVDACHSQGFVYGLSTDSWFGGSPPPSLNNVQTRSRVLQVDNFGRVRSTRYDNDVFRSDDDVCTENEFAAAPTNAFPRVLTALAKRRVTDCTPEVIFASESWEYDGLPAGAVSNGRLTSHTVDRRATDSGQLLRSVRLFDATYDVAGTLAAVHMQRDGVKRTTTLAYDPFGLVQVANLVEATDLPSMASSAIYDPVSLDLLDSVSINGTHSGTEFDGFGRPLRNTVRVPGGPLGVLSTISYEGFSGTDPNGRRIIAKTFSDPVAPVDAASTAGRTATVFLDELGRKRRTELSLGNDYANESLVLNARVYDLAGRVAFQADPYPLSQASVNPYGTSYHFKNTGDLNCIIRGFGQQPLNNQTDIASERFPTCFQRSTDNHVLTLDVQDAASLQPGSPQAGVVRRVVSTAIGRTIERSTVKAGTRLDHATFSYDRLGQLRSMARYLDPIGATNPVEFSVSRDSTSQILQLEEPASATLNFRYSDWGELVETRWMDGATNRQMLRTYDALGRLIQTEERNNGIVDPETVNTYAYDVAANVSPHVSPTFVLGRPALARSPNAQVAFSYDALGRVNARVFSDGEGGPYIDKFEHRADGSLATLEFNLPDQNYESEIVKYGYDSADRLRTIMQADASGAGELYKVHEIDPFGRVRKATYGADTIYSADYADQGRRLIREGEVKSPSGGRLLSFLGVDPLERKLSRREIKDGAAFGPKTDFSYDALGRLQGVGTGIFETKVSHFRYDPLGNIVSQTTFPPSPGVWLSYDAADRDRLCRIDYGPGSGGACNVLHDARGNIISEPTRTGTREFSYFSSGGVRTISSQGVQAHFAYDAFGQVQKINVEGSNVENRRDRRYGGLIERRDVTSGGSTATQIIRRIPGAGGIMVSRRGPGNQWVFELGELRGNRFFINRAGAFIQDVDYEPFGEATSTGAQPGTADYTSYQWNGRDALAAFGLSHLGARLYDPVIGRFLSRDPILVSRDGSIKNPYAFASNDPVNFADPTGFETAFGEEAEEEEEEEEELQKQEEGIAKYVLAGAAPELIGEGLVEISHTLKLHSTFIATLHETSGGWMKFAGRVTSSADLVSSSRRYLRHPSRENLGRLIVTSVEAAALEWGGIYGKAWFVGSKIGMMRWEAQQDELKRMEFKIRELKYPIHVEFQKRLRELRKRLPELIRQVEVERDVCPMCWSPELGEISRSGWITSGWLSEENISVLYRIYYGGALPERDINPVPPQLTLRREQSIGPPTYAKTASDVWSGLPLPPVGCNLAESRC